MGLSTKLVHKLIEIYFSKNRLKQSVKFRLRPLEKKKKTFSKAKFNFYLFWIAKLNKSKTDFKDCCVTMTFVFDSLDNDLISIDSNGTLDKLQYSQMVSGAKRFAEDKLLPYFKQLTSKAIN